MVILNIEKYWKAWLLTAYLLILIQLSISTVTGYDIYEPCERTVVNCSTQLDFIRYNCRPGDEILLRDSCNKKTDLNCVDEICMPHCSPSQSLVYSYTAKRCVTRPGELCNFLRPCQEPTVCLFGGLETDMTRRCYCPGGSQMVNGTCTKLVVYNKECGSPSIEGSQRNCDHGASIHCINGTCSCARKGQVFYAKWNRCLSMVGQLCNVHRHCIPTAYCNGSKRFQCSSNGRPSENGLFCIITAVGVTCDSDDELLQCDPLLGLECINSKCNCRDGSILTSASLGVTKKSVCRVMAGKSCNQRKVSGIEAVSRNSLYRSGDCVLNAVCFDGICQCQDGYSETQIGTCSMSFGQACNYTGPECNSDHGLGCVHEKCACSDSHFNFNPNTLSCQDPFEMTPTDPYTETYITDESEWKNSAPKSEVLIPMIIGLVLSVLLL